LKVPDLSEEHGTLALFVRAAEPGASQKLENAPVGVLPEVMTGVDQAAQHTLLVRVGHREVQQLETPSRREDASMSGAVISHELWQRRLAVPMTRSGRRSPPANMRGRLWA
jgi:hypothetical protein